MKIHQMTLFASHEGTEEWCCPICGRCIFIEWEPFQKVVLELGDENVSHAVIKLGVSWIIPAEDK